jgi:hypothetical protein
MSKTLMTLIITFRWTMSIKIWQTIKRFLLFWMISTFKSICLITRLYQIQRGRTSVCKKWIYVNKISSSKSFRNPKTKCLSLKRKFYSFKSKLKSKLSKIKPLSSTSKPTPNSAWRHQSYNP